MSKINKDHHSVNLRMDTEMFDAVRQHAKVSGLPVATYIKSEIRKILNRRAKNKSA